MVSDHGLARGQTGRGRSKFAAVALSYSICHFATLCDKTPSRRAPLGTGHRSKDSSPKHAYVINTLFLQNCGCYEFIFGGGRKMPLSPMNGPLSLKKRLSGPLRLGAERGLDLKVRNLRGFSRQKIIRKRGGVQKSMGNKVLWKTGMLIYLPVTSRPLISLQKEAVLSPCNFATI